MVKTLMKQIKEYKKDSLLTMLFATLEVKNLFYIL